MNSLVIVFLPPILLIIVLISVYLALWASSHVNLALIYQQTHTFFNLCNNKFSNRVRHHSLEQQTDDYGDNEDNNERMGRKTSATRNNIDDSLDSNFGLDKDELRRLVERAQDRFYPLMGIVLPGIVSALACLSVILIGPPLVAFMWPDGFPENSINDALESFMVPASLLYALVFTLSFELVTEKQSVIRSYFAKEVNLLYELLNLQHNFSTQDKYQSAVVTLQIAKLVHAQALDLVRQTQGGNNRYKNDQFMEKHLKQMRLFHDAEDNIFSLEKNSTYNPNKQILDPLSTTENQTNPKSSFPIDYLNKDYARQLWLLLPQIRKLVEIGGKDTINNIILSKIMDTIMDFAEAVSQRRAMSHQRLNSLQWFFLEFLGFITFLAVLLIKAESMPFELTMCMLTAFSIALLNLIIADADDPFNGYFKVNTKNLVQLVQQTALEIQRVRGMLAMGAFEQMKGKIKRDKLSLKEAAEALM